MSFYKYKRKVNPSIWKARNSQYGIRGNKSNQPDLSDQFFEIDQLKSATKRISIASKMEKRKQRFKSPTSNQIIGRPKTAQQKQLSKELNFKQMKQIYKKQRKLNEQILNTNNKQSKRDGSQVQKYTIKDGILGQYQYYQKMTKRQLIEKLISLEILANTIFKRNKYLEEKLNQTGFVGHQLT